MHLWFRDDLNLRPTICGCWFTIIQGNVMRIELEVPVTGIIWDTNPLRNKCPYTLINMHRFALTLHSDREYRITHIV